MSCNLCKKAQALRAARNGAPKTDAPLAAPRSVQLSGTLDATSGLPYLLKAGTRYVGSSKFRRSLITSCVIPSMRAPRGGWGISVKIKGQTHKITSGGPVKVFNAVKELLTLNEITFTDPDLWLNLNLEWLSRAVMRYQKITTKDLTEVAIPNPDYNEEEF